MRQERALDDLGSAGAHGDMAAWHARVRALSGHSKARGGAHEVRKGKAVLTRAKSEGERERKGGGPWSRAALVRSVVLRQAIAAGSSLTTSKGDEQKLRDAEAKVWRRCSEL